MALVLSTFIVNVRDLTVYRSNRRSNFSFSENHLETAEDSTLSDYIAGTDDHFYKMHTSLKTWREAESICRLEGGHLAMEKSQATRDFIIKTWPDDVFWIGVHDINTEDSFEFADGTVVETSYWLDGQPDNWGEKEDCVIHNNNTHEWRDEACNLDFNFLCQRGSFKFSVLYRVFHAK